MEDEMRYGGFQRCNTVVKVFDSKDRRLKISIDFAAADAKIRYDARHTPLIFDVRNKAYLKLHHGYNLPGKPPRKWPQQRVGPLTVIRRVGHQGTMGRIVVAR